MSETKQIKFQFVVDQGSAREVERVLNNMIEKAKELGKTLQNVGGGPQGLMGGVKGTSGSSQSTLAGKGGSVAQKTSFSQILGGSAEGFKKLASESAISMKAMTDSLKSATQQQQSAVDKLGKELDQLGRIYDRVGGKASKAFAGELQSRITAKTKELASAKGELGKLHGMAPELMPEVPWPGQETPEAKESMWAKLTKSRSMPGSGAMEGMMGKSSMGQLLGGMGITPGMMVGAALGMVGAWGLKNIYKQIEGAPDQFLASEAKQGTMLGQRSLELRGGDFRNKIAEQEILRDTEKRKDYEDLDSGWRRFKSSAGAFFSGDFADSFTGRAADQATKERRNKQVEMQRATDPLMDAIQGEAQNFRATLGSMRAMGVGAKKGMTGFDALARHRAAYSAFDDGEIAAAFQGIQGAGTRGAAHRLQGFAMHGTAAGISGAAGSIGTMSKFGGGNAFANQMLQMAGGGKIDASTVGMLTSYIASQQDRLGMATAAPKGQYQGQGLMEMISAGTQGEGGRLIGEQNIRGVDYLQRAMTGQTSGYQSARNYMIAGEAAPGLNMYGQGFLSSKMSMTELADAASGKGGDVSAIFKALGGNKEQAGQYFKGVTSSLLEGVSGEGMGDTDSGKLIRAMVESGQDPREFFKKGGYKNLKGANGKKMTQEQAIAAYGGALQASDADMDPAAAMGAARAIAGVSEGAAKGKGKAGAGGIPETELAAQQMKLLATQSQAATQALEMMTQAAKTNAEQAKFEAAHRAPGSQLNQDDRLVAERYFAGTKDGTAAGAEKAIELDHQAQASKRAAQAAEAEKRRQEQIQRRWDKY